ncbi:uroporphyrinogen decarboxylase family protein [Labilibacter marinus]|uniref:uroporphyrinogen decarboxylase family protein n=1 Tax=Labilibacter marinus TaxID=1477105 RepID=UPI00094F7F26|nr:uroporphyrinogen decarboxylase family protein [Labilibacter marinus]
MNSIERVSAILNHQEADRVPVYPLINGVNRKFTNSSYKTWATDADVCADSYLKATDELDLDVICTLIDLSVEASDFGQEIIYPENEAAHPNFKNHLLKSSEEYNKVKYVNPLEAPRMKMHIDLCDKIMKAKGKEKPVVAFVFGPLGILSMLRGQVDLFTDIYMVPEDIKTAVEEINKTLYEYCDALIETGVHAIMFDTLFASQSIMSPEMWMEFEGVFMKPLADYVRSKGCMVMIHNCGHGIYFKEQIEAMKPVAISFLHVPACCSSFKETKEKYGKDITLIGCIPPTDLPRNTKEEVENVCKEQIDLFAKDGGFILATGCEYPANLEFDHAKTIVNMAKTYGQYN